MGQAWFWGEFAVGELALEAISKAQAPLVYILETKYKKIIKLK